MWFTIIIIGKQSSLVWLLLLGSATGCVGFPDEKVERRQTVSLPGSVAILTADSSDLLFSQDAMLEQAYDRLESRSWQLLTERSGVRVLERRDLQIVRAEQRSQHAYGIDESSAVRLGRLAGARAVLVYRIWLPPWRDRFLDKDHALPFTLTGKLVDVETGAVLWAHSVTVLTSDCRRGDCWFGGRPRGPIWPTLASGIDHLIVELAQVVPCRPAC